ncbi:uncharacterized protein V6R79_022945 [Siganus canaliculatus]
MCNANDILSYLAEFQVEDSSSARHFFWLAYTYGMYNHLASMPTTSERNHNNFSNISWCCGMRMKALPTFYFHGLLPASAMPLCSINLYVNRTCYSNSSCRTKPHFILFCQLPATVATANVHQPLLVSPSTSISSYPAHHDSILCHLCLAARQPQQPASIITLTRQNPSCQFPAMAAAYISQDTIHQDVDVPAAYLQQSQQSLTSTAPRKSMLLSPISSNCTSPHHHLWRRGTGMLEPLPPAPSD